ncbi:MULTISPECIES: glycosyltransferase family 2 protein [Gordonia]|uniref:Glycosyltransferase n=1 Tax=Gordonia tangerina TaxID=2911060 RepID=A0ABS9DLN9_9ACTN|nr:glycosyltransferase family 2 protein [Gordonia tangerina]MCF3940159.1 glycosyltransferase [Gordonia tangerina]
MFSFLMTAYGTEGYLPTTIASVVSQTRDDWELVVVDNGMSDDIARIVQMYQVDNPRIRLVRQENKGYRGGVMAAAAAATGEFVCVLDSDDHLAPEFCARVGAFLDENPDVDAVGIDAHRFSEPEELNLPTGYMRSIGVTARADPDRPLTFRDVIGGRVPYYTAAIRRTAWDDVGGYEPGIDDVDESVLIWCRLVERFDVRLLPDRLARYRIRPDSLSREPAKVEAFERQLMRSFAEAARESAVAEHQVAADETLRGLRYHQAIRRARQSLLDGDAVAAQQAARSAVTEKRTVRSTAIFVAVTLTPRLVTRIHPVKQHMTRYVELVVGRVGQATH